MRLVEFVVGAAVLVFMAILGAIIVSALTHALTLPGLPIRMDYRPAAVAYTTAFAAAFIALGILVLFWYVPTLIRGGQGGGEAW